LVDLKIGKIIPKTKNVGDFIRFAEIGAIAYHCILKVMVFHLFEPFGPARAVLMTPAK